MSTILIHIADKSWTTNAMRRACVMAHAEDEKATITLLHLMPVQYLEWLGTDFGYQPMTREERVTVRACTRIAEDYDIEMVVQSMQCISSADAVVQAADQLSAATVFAKAQPGLFSEWRLKHHLAVHGHTLTPAIQS